MYLFTDRYTYKLCMYSCASQLSSSYIIASVQPLVHMGEKQITELCVKGMKTITDDVLTLKIELMIL